MPVADESRSIAPTRWHLGNESPTNLLTGIALVSLAMAVGASSWPSFLHRPDAVVGTAWDVPLRADQTANRQPHRTPLPYGETLARIEADSHDSPPESADDNRPTGGDRQLNHAALTRSLELGRSFLLQSQLPNGLFRYHYNYLTGQEAAEQSPVRQAGALWGLALLHHEMPSPETRQALAKGFDFFARQSHLTTDGRRFIRFPGTVQGHSGTMALVALALIEFLESDGAEQHPARRRELGEYLAFLKSLERFDHRYHARYHLGTGVGWGDASPYFDGEILLAMANADHLLTDADLRSRASRLAEAIDRYYVKDAVDNSVDNPLTKGCFQWVCLAHAEMFRRNWPETESYAQRTIQLAHWMIDVHKTLQRRLNTAYALEGIIAAHQVARATGDRASCVKFHAVVRQSLIKLNSWQLGSRQPCEFLQQHPPEKRQDLGGVLRSKDRPWLRIDVTQHQMHAVILARRHLWPPSQ